MHVAYVHVTNGATCQSCTFLGGHRSPPSLSLVLNLSSNSVPVTAVATETKQTWSEDGGFFGGTVRVRELWGNAGRFNVNEKVEKRYRKHEKVREGVAGPSLEKKIKDWLLLFCQDAFW